MIVLNSLTNLAKVKNGLTAYGSIATFLDNDDAGKQAVRELKSCYPNVTDQSEFYARHKDLNEYLCSKKLLPKKQMRKGFKL